jgi:hypothetical protein
MNPFAAGVSSTLLRTVVEGTERNGPYRPCVVS